MTSIKVKFRPSTLAGSEGTVYYQIIRSRVVRQLPTDYRILPEEWDPERSSLRLAGDGERRMYLMSVRDRIRWDLERISRIDRELENGCIPYTPDDIIERFNSYAREYSLFNFMESIIARMKQYGKQRTSETYRAALNSFRKYRGGEDLMLDSMTSGIMEGYEAWQKGRGMAPNTISFYTRILRAVYNRAVEQGVIENRRPFARVYTGVDKTVKRALPLVGIRRIRSMDLSMAPALDYARDMFMMSFFMRGMSFIDMAYLKKIDLRNGYVVYRRRKTGQQLVIEWRREMQTILDKYPENESDYLLPIIRRSGMNDRSVYQNAAYNINRNLKQIGEMAGLAIPLTMYVARHSWASVARAKGIPVRVISEGMGHDSEATTQIYLASLDTSAVDRANSKIIKSLI